jgi:hypothetical protein
VGELGPVKRRPRVGAEIDLDEVEDRPEDPVSHELGIAVADRPRRHALLDVVRGVGGDDLLPAIDEGGELLVARRGANESEEARIDAKEFDGRLDAPLDADPGVGDPLDGDVLGAPEVKQRFLQQLGEQGLFGFEVPVEDALADPELVAHVGDRRAVIALFGKEAGGGGDDLLPPSASPLGELPGCHSSPVFAFRVPVRWPKTDDE